ncbi:hypothetical protein CERSUDRAFT_104329 [Gelatoporia subvermispora B]|uniref:FAD-binding domain-containing protein n=1 Tax=Ceriporiopsis subvermispora (strain B) TaxID=914234 RepID=M2RKR5_CERS8|nr:hypothetical protein CERSUDRAFT_104329 [Gelatoporia subvermispora B]
MLTKSSDVPVLVVGAGPAGLIMALSLAKNGVHCRIIDKGQTFHTGSRGFGIQPRTFELFQSLGMLDDFVGVVQPLPMMRAYKLPGGVEPVRTWRLYPPSPSWPDRPFAEQKILSQAKLEAIFRKHLAEHNIEVELGTELIGIEHDEDGATATLLVSKADGIAAKETVRCEYLIGADGARGVSRKLMGMTFEGQTRDADGMVWADVTISNLSTEYWHVWGQPGKFSIMARPLSPTGNTFVVGITCQNYDAVGLANESSFKEFMSTETGRGDLEFGEFAWLSYFKPNMRVVNQFSEGRVFLVGDSAHVHSPTGGQGMNCSIADSFNLAWKLVLAHKGLASPALLPSYSAERLPVITQMLAATNELYTHTVARKTTVLAEDAAPDGSQDADDDTKTGWFRWRNGALGLFGVNYRYSPIVFDARPSEAGQDEEDMHARAYEGYIGNVRAGDRAPEAPGLFCASSTDTEVKETSIFDLLSPSRHTVLVFAADTSARQELVLEALQKYPEDFVQGFLITRQTPSGTQFRKAIVDQGGHAFRSYGYSTESDKLEIAVVRPDGVIGAMVSTIDGLHAYFRKVMSL